MKQRTGNESAAPPKNRTACTILITALEAGEDGKMNVEMSYEGDTCLAAYLLEDAKCFIDEKIEEEYLSEAPQLRVVK